MESSVAGVRPPLEVAQHPDGRRGPDGTRVVPIRPFRTSDGPEAPRTVPAAPAGAGEVARVHASATDVIAVLVAALKRMRLSIGENVPPYLPTPKQPASLDEAGARARSLDVQRELVRESPRTLATSHEALRRIAGAGSA
jgi:hypothetical protein